jgi:hypothetical protein
MVCRSRCAARFRYKLPWIAFVDGVLSVRVRRLDAAGDGVGREAHIR